MPVRLSSAFVTSFNCKFSSLKANSLSSSESYGLSVAKKKKKTIVN